MQTNAAMIKKLFYPSGSFSRIFIERQDGYFKVCNGQAMVILDQEHKLFTYPVFQGNNLPAYNGACIEYNTNLVGDQQSRTDGFVSHIVSANRKSEDEQLLKATQFLFDANGVHVRVLKNDDENLLQFVDDRYLQCFKGYHRIWTSDLINEAGIEISGNDLYMFVMPYKVGDFGDKLGEICSAWGTS